MSRTLVPRPTPENQNNNMQSSSSSSSQQANKPRKISTACNACKQRKTRCTGGTPCEACESRRSPCVYDVLSDQRRKIANQRNVHDLAEAQENLDRLRQLLGGIIATVRVGGPQATDDLLAVIRSGIELSQLAAHVRNARRANQSIDHAYSQIDFTIDGGDELPSPEHLLSATASGLFLPERHDEL